MPDVRKINLRLPGELHAALLERAEWERSSANAVMVAALRRHLGAERSSGRVASGVAASPRSQQRSEVERFERPAEGVNAPCPCGSGRKWKKCHGAPA